MMTITMQDVVRLLLPDEGNLHAAAAALGPEALPYLRTLIDGDDLMLATNAVYVAGLIPGGAELVQHAASKEERALRMTAATVAQKMPAEHAGPIVARLLRDHDAETRKMAIDAVSAAASSEVRAALEGIAASDPHPHLRTLSEKALHRSK